MNSQSDPGVVLIIDDAGGARDQTQHTLEKMGYRTLAAGRVQEGLELIQKKQVRTVLLDPAVGGSDTLDALWGIHARHPQLPVIVTGRMATVRAATDAMKNGAFDFIAKPFEPDQLRSALCLADEKLRQDHDRDRNRDHEVETISRREALAQLDPVQEKSRYLAIIESLPNGVLVTDAHAHAVLLNPVFCRYLGLPERTVPGKPVSHYLSDPGLRDMVTALSTRCRTAGQDTPNYEFSSNGRFLLARGRPVTAQDHGCLGAVVTLEDISAMKVLDRLKNEFVSKVSHELRSPLSTIHEQLAMVLDDLAGDASPADTHLLSRAKEKTQGLIYLIGDLLDLSRIESGVVCQDPKPVLLDDLLENIIDFLSAKAAAKNQSLLFTREKGALAPVNADPLALESIFGNLITNAINYTPEGGRIEVKLEAAGDRLQVQVADNGFGIEQRHHQKIFERFYRVKNENTRYITGTGLGLPIVKGLVDTLKGSITVKSAPHEGSVFTVQLPAG